ncbi:2-oxoglutarate dehydrogenase E1, partial [Acinetobacter baumannii]
MTRHRGELAIHASKKIDKETCRQEPFRSVLARHGYTESNLPVGMILATGQLADCLKVEFDEGNLAVLDAGQVILGNEYDFGDYTEGRYAWELLYVRPLDKPISAKGQLNLWEYPLEE